MVIMPYKINARREGKSKMLCIERRKVGVRDGARRTRQRNQRRF